MRLIVTRPEADAQTLAERLRQHGHEALIAPLLKIVPRLDTELPDHSWQALCISSANALAGPLTLPLSRDIPVYCVGPQSANAAAHAGFTDVRPRGGNLQGLLTALVAERDAAQGPILYLSGAETSGDLPGLLRARGFACHRIITYDAMSVPPPLSASDIWAADGVLLYSARTARLWHAFAAPYLGEGPKSFTHFCLSQNVAEMLPQAWRRKVAAAATEEHMLSLLDQCGEAE